MTGLQACDLVKVYMQCTCQEEASTETKQGPEALLHCLVYHSRSSDGQQPGLRWENIMSQWYLNNDI